MKAMHFQANTSVEGGSQSKMSFFTFALIVGVGISTSFLGVAQNPHGDRGRGDDDRGRKEKYDKHDKGRGYDRYDNNRGGDRYDNRKVVVVNRRPQTTVVYRNNTPNWRYASLPRRNSVVNVAPSTSISVSFGGINFRYNNGVYYRPYQNTYIVTPAPIGIRVRYLPREHRVFNLYNHSYHYYNGAYYEYQNNDYVVVPPPVGALVESIPDGYEKLQVNGDTYYIVDGVQYRAVLQNGEIWYEVIKIIG